MDEKNTTSTKGPRYDVAMPRDRRPGEPITWFVIDTSGRLRPRRVGSGVQGLREALCLVRVLNGL
jgi:hypothetical protein